MKTFEFEVGFNTPAFIGGANQNSEWRTPPIKALMRHWWRFVWASNNRGNLDNIASLKACEGELFGDTDKQALVRIRLWDWANAKDIVRSQPYDYLRFGKTSGTGIGVNETATLLIAVPDDYENVIGSIMSHIQGYGTVGGRSRNGWGSIRLTLPQDKQMLEALTNAEIVSDWKDAVQYGWPHAIGRDVRGALIWQTKEYPKWESVMNQLAELRKVINRESKTSDSRHLLSYPVTQNKKLKSVVERMPSALRFKVRSNQVSGKRIYTGIVYFVPSTPKEVFRRYGPDVIRSWEQVFNFLDNGTKNTLKRVDLKQL